MDLEKIPIFCEETIHNHLFLDLIDHLEELILNTNNSSNTSNTSNINVRFISETNLFKIKFKNELFLFDLFAKLNCYVDDLFSHYSNSARRPLLNYDCYCNQNVEIYNDDSLDADLNRMIEYDDVTFVKSNYVLNDLISDSIVNKKNHFNKIEKLYEIGVNINNNLICSNSILKSHITAALKICELRILTSYENETEKEIFIGIEDNSESGYVVNYNSFDLLLIDNSLKHTIVTCNRNTPLKDKESKNYKIIYHTDEKVEKMTEMIYFSFKTNINQSIRHLIIDPFNKRYCINVYPLKTLNFIIYNFSSDFECESELYNNLAIKLINEIFILIKLKILESQMFIQYVYKSLLSWYSNKGVSPLVIYYYFTLGNYSINNFMYSSEVNTSKKLFFRLITENYLWDDNMIIIKENLIDLLISLVNINDQDQISFLFNMIFINKDEDDSQIFMNSQNNSENLTLSAINSKSDQDSIVKDKQSINKSIRKETLFKLIKKVYECTVLTLYEKSLILKYSENLTLSQNFELFMSLPNSEYKLRLIDNMLSDKYSTLNLEFNELNIMHKGIISDKKLDFSMNLPFNSIYSSLDQRYINKHHLEYCILKNFVKKQHYNQSLNIYFRKKFLELMEYLITRENMHKCYFYYYFLKTKDVLSIKNTSNYIALRDKLCHYFGIHLDFTVDFIEDYIELANNIDICEFKEGIFLI